AVPLAVPYPRELQVIASRDTHDFDERDRLILGLLGPHFSAGVAHAEAISGLEAELAAFRQGLEADGRAVILLGPGRRIRHISERAQEWLIAYFGARRPAPRSRRAAVGARRVAAAAAGRRRPARRPVRAAPSARRRVQRQAADRACLVDGRTDVPAAERAEA